MGQGVSGFYSQGMSSLTAVLGGAAVAHAEESPPVQWGGRSGGIGSRRRAGTETPTDSNVAEWDDQWGALGMACELLEPLDDKNWVQENATDGWD